MKGLFLQKKKSNIIWSGRIRNVFDMPRIAWMSFFSTAPLLWISFLPVRVSSSPGLTMKTGALHRATGEWTALLRRWQCTIIQKYFKIPQLFKKRYQNGHYCLYSVHLADHKLQHRYFIFTYKSLRAPQDSSWRQKPFTELQGSDLPYSEDAQLLKNIFKPTNI